MIVRRTLGPALALAIVSAPASAETCIEAYQGLTEYYVANMKKAAQRSRDISKFMRVLSPLLGDLRSGTKLTSDIPSELIALVAALSRELDSEAALHDKLRKDTVELLGALQRDCG